MNSDLHTFELFDADMPLVVESNSFPIHSDTSSTGYLQDAIAQWNNRGKREWAQTAYDYPPYHSTSDDDQQHNCLQVLLNSNYQDEQFASSDNSATNSQQSSVAMSNGSSSSTAQASTKQQIPLYSTPDSNRLAMEDMNRLTKWRDRPSYSDTETSKQLSWKNVVAYPFEVVKPGGEEEDVTLEDINARIQRRPNRPIPHPTDEFACQPRVLSAHHGQTSLANPSPHSPPYKLKAGAQSPSSEPATKLT